MLSIINMNDYLNVYSSPCLLMQKSASFFAVPQDIYDDSAKERRFLMQRGFNLQLLYTLQDKAHLMLYSRTLLKKTLSIKDVKKALHFFGYSCINRLDSLLQLLFVRLYEFGKARETHKNTCFPHEMGLFLDYPPDDVMQYYIKKGKDYIFSGYWKVYAKPEWALKQFKKYDMCRLLCLKYGFCEFI